MKSEDLGNEKEAKKNWNYQYDIQYFKMRKKIEDIMKYSKPNILEYFLLIVVNLSILEKATSAIVAPE